MTTPSAFDQALQSWTEINLPSIQKRLDDHGLAVKEDQKASVLTRKTLAGKTKDFKKLADSDKLAEIKPLLKLYQNEIDSLTNHKKAVEGYFFEMYRVLSEAPDPKPLLEVSLDSVIKSSEIDELNRQLEEVTVELNKRADYDQLQQRLVDTEQSSSRVLEQRLKQQAQELNGIMEEKEANWSEKERQWQDQLKAAQKQMEELRTHNEVATLQAKNTVSERAPAAIIAELEFVTRDVESQKTRNLELEKRNEQLRRQLAAAESEARVVELEQLYKKQVSVLEGENSLLVANLDQLRTKLDGLASEKVAASESESKRVAGLSEEVAKLKSKLERVFDYDELKHEVQLLRQLEFGVDDENETVDSQLILKNKTLTNQVVELRQVVEDGKSRINELELAISATSAELQQAQSLNLKLEDDLAGVDAAPRLNDTASMISFAPSVAPSESGPSILPIITKQRDRFRNRNAELEEEAKRHQTTIAELKRKVGQLKQDNEQLYERTQYMASFSGNRKLTPRANTADDNPYRQSYEQKIHPLEQFRVQEQERINSGLSPVERLFISFTRTILATRLTRMVFFFYCLALHLVVMLITIYSMSASSSYLPDVGHGESQGGLANGQVGAPNQLADVRD